MTIQTIVMDHNDVRRALASGELPKPEPMATGFWHVELQTYASAPFLALDVGGEPEVYEGATADDALAAWRAGSEYSTHPGDYQSIKAVPAPEPEPEPEPTYPEISVATTVRDLRAALTACGKVVGRSSAPILECVTFRADGGHVTVAGMSNDLAALLTVDLEVGAASADGVCVANLKELRKCLAKRPAGEVVTIHADGTAQRATVTVGAAQYQVAAFGPDDLPAPAVVDGELAEVDAAAFVQVLGDVAAAMSSEETRYYLNGVALQRRDGNLWAIATDGHRMHVRETGIAWPDCESVILPALAVRTILHAARKPSGTVLLEVGTAGANFAGDGWALAAKLIDGTFPDWERVIPVRPTDSDWHVATLEVAPTADACKAVWGHSEFNFAEGAIRARNGESTAELPMARVNGECGLEKIGVNAAYVGDVLERFDASGTVDLGMADGIAPILITAPAKPDFRAVVMPVRL